MAFVVSGYIEPGFEALQDAFRGNFLQRGDVGAACALYYQGRCVADLWGGLRDPVSSVPWQRNTIQLAFSAAKGVTSVAMLQLAEQGMVNLDASVASYWPEFAANGKEAITLRMVMSHQAGLAAIDGDLSLDEALSWEPVVTAIARQAPNWEPGKAHGYHARSFGWILGEVLKRVTGQTAGEYVRREIAQPLGLRCWIGLPQAELSRCARIVPPAGGGTDFARLLGADSLTARVMSGPSNLFAYNEMWNTPALLSAELPSSNLVTDAHSLARLYAALLDEVDGCRLLLPSTVEEACRVQVEGSDKVTLGETRFGTGFMLPTGLAPGCGAHSFGHPGAGGSLGFADPVAGLAFGYVTNVMRFEKDGDPRLRALINAAYASL